MKRTKKDKHQENKLLRKINAVLPDEVSIRVGGYHPMARGKSFKDVESPAQNGLSIVDQKAASILLQWLSLKLKMDGYTEVELKSYLRGESRK